MIPLSFRSPTRWSPISWQQNNMNSCELLHSLYLLLLWVSFIRTGFPCTCVQWSPQEKDRKHINIRVISFAFSILSILWLSLYIQYVCRWQKWKIYHWGIEEMNLRTSFIKGTFPFKVVLHHRLSSTKSRFNQRTSLIKGCPLSKVVLQQRSYSIQGYLP